MSENVVAVRSTVSQEVKEKASAVLETMDLTLSDVLCQSRTQAPNAHHLSA